MMMLGLMFVWSVQPYSMIISLMMMTLGYSLFIYYGMSSYWYSYMLVLVVMSGVLVLFTYIASMIPNEMFEYVGLLYVSLFIYLMVMMKFSNKILFYGDMSIMLLKAWDMVVSLYNLYLVLLLLVVMVMVVWLSSFDSSAVRNF